MTEHLVKAGANAPVNEDKLSRIPHLHTWFRTQCAVVMHLTNGTIQVCFFNFSFFLNFNFFVFFFSSISPIMSK